MNAIKSSFVQLILASLILVLWFAMDTPPTVRAQELVANNNHLYAPTPEVLPAYAVIRAPIRTPPTFNHRRLNSVSIAALIAGEAVDSWGTYRNLNHTKWVCGNSPAFDGVYDTNVPGEISSIRDVQRVCGAGPTGQSPNWAFDVTRAGYFSEGGWVTQFHLAGNRNYAAVEGLNLANDLGWYLIARRLGKRTDWVRKFGPAVNFGRGMVHLELGIGNFLAVSHHQNPNTLDLHIPTDSNYTPPRWWGKN
jgi:hypothetical protein